MRPLGGLPRVHLPSLVCVRLVAGAAAWPTLDLRRTMFPSLRMQLGWPSTSPTYWPPQFSIDPSTGT